MSWGRYRLEVAVEVEADDPASAIMVVEGELREAFNTFEVLYEPELVAQLGDRS